MPTFDFTPIKKKSGERKGSNGNSKYEVLLKDIKGVVFIDINANYFVKVNNTSYNIITENYNCGGVANVYLQQLDNNLQRVLYIRHEEYKPNLDTQHYLPFTAGCCVTGHIVKNKLNNVSQFNIKKVYIDYNDTEAQKAIKFYRENYIEISKIRRERLLKSYE